MRIGILGAGGVGGYFGGRLAKAGHQVTFVARGAHGAALQAEGLTVLTPLGDFSVKPVTVVERPEMLGPQDVVINCVKLWDLEASGRSLALGRDEGMTKLLFDPETHRVLGGGVVGPGAGDLISEVALAIEMDCEAADLGLTVHPHPTLSETVAMAAEAFEGTLTDLYLPRKP